MRLRTNRLVAIAALSAVSCAQDPAEVATPGAVEVAGTQTPSVETSIRQIGSEQRLIRDGFLTIEADDVELAVEAAERAVTERGARVADAETVRLDNGRRRSVLSVRVPAERFDDTMRALRGLGRVESERFHTQDVTKAYADLEIRIAVKRTAQSRLRELLSGRTGTLADVLDVERELSRVVGEIEELEGERRFYDRRIALSTIEVELYEPRRVLQAGTFAPVRRALIDALAVLATSVSVLVYVLVFVTPWLTLVPPLRWLVRRSRPTRA